MGMTYDNFVLKNATDLGKFLEGTIKETDIRQQNVKFLIDTGSHEVYITEEIARKLGLLERRGKLVAIGGGKKVLCKEFSPVEIEWKDHNYTTSPRLMPGQETPILGVYGLEGLYLKVNPVTQTLEENLTNGTMGFMYFLMA
jgi:clan AA aspartic protease